MLPTGFPAESVTTAVTETNCVSTQTTSPVYTCSTAFGEFGVAGDRFSIPDGIKEPREFAPLTMAKSFVLMFWPKAHQRLHHGTEEGAYAICERHCKSSPKGYRRGTKTAARSHPIRSERWRFFSRTRCCDTFVSQLTRGRHISVGEIALPVSELDLLLAELRVGNLDFHLTKRAILLSVGWRIG